jgi:hypothetical protein
MTARPRLSVALGCLAVLAIGACTTVPARSAPQVIHSVEVGQPPPQAPLPPPNAPPREIVSDFLAAENAGDDVNHTGARAYLTAEQRNRWSDDSVTVIAQQTTGNLINHKVTVSGRQIGTIDANGVYTPTLRGDGTGIGGLPVHQSFGLRKVAGQWRISSLQSGMLINESYFAEYQQRVLYFFDSSFAHLIADPRYTQLSDPRDLSTWLVQQLAQGPHGGPQSGLQTALPNQTVGKPVAVQFGKDGTQLTAEMPGSSQLSASNRDRLAAQLAETVAQVNEISSLQITDGGTPVRIPAAANATSFSLADLDRTFLSGMSGVAPTLYYVLDGAVHTATGHRIPGNVGAGSYGLSSAALSKPTDTGTVLVAGVHGTGSRQYLDIGRPDLLRRTRLQGRLTRPTWAPNAPEAWVGSGHDLYRASYPSATVRTVPINAQQGGVHGTILAVRLSPEGSRVAIVLRSDGTSQIYVGSVVRNGTDVRVTDLAPISPQGIVVNDVAWNDQLKLFAIGRNRATHTWGLWEVQSDGSLWTLRSDSGLPQPPDSLTVSAGSVAVVSAGDTVWRQQLSSWEPLGADETHGSNPVYDE